MGIVTCVKENSRPAIPNIISATEMRKYWGISQKMLTLFGGWIMKDLLNLKQG